jgi:RNA polymerase sigma-70 factor (ECF subfamily)
MGGDDRRSGGPTPAAFTAPAEPAAPGAPPQDLAASFEDFYEIEEAGLFGALALITGNRHDAEDLKQEAFLKVWERWDAVQGMTSPTGYLYRTAMNAFRGRLRRAKLAARKAVDPERGRDLFDAADSRNDLVRALAALTERQRAAIVMTQLLEFTTAEAARMLGVRPPTVRKFVSLGKHALRGSMGTDDE